MTDMPEKAIGGPSAWRAADLAASDSWQYRLKPEEVAEIDAALTQAKKSGKPVEQCGKEDFPLPSFSGTITRIRGEVDAGPGVRLLKGVPFDRYDKADCARIAWGIGAHIGGAVSQNARGELVGHVIDTGRDARNRIVRGYETATRQPFHTDYTDIVMLACLHPAKSGGASLIASATAIHDAMLASRPDLLAELYRPFHTDHRGEEPPGSPPWYALPVFAAAPGGGIIVRYSRAYIESAQQIEGVPPLTQRQRAALDMLDALAASPELCVTMQLETGDIQLLSNYTVLHSRNAYEDDPDPARMRHLIRLWLNVPDRTPLPVFDSAAGRVDIGMLRGGVPPKRIAA